MESREEKLLQIRTAFEQYYQEFEASGYDTLLIMDFIVRMDEAGLFEGVSENLYYDWRILFEYFLRRLPKDEIIVRELLLIRVNDLWTKQREEESRKEILKKSENIGNNLIRNFLYSLSLTLQKFGFVKEREVLRESDTPSQLTNTTNYISENGENQTISLLKKDVSLLIAVLNNSSYQFNPELFAQSFGFKYDDSIKKMQYKKNRKNLRVYRIIKEMTSYISDEQKAELKSQLFSN